MMSLEGSLASSDPIVELPSVESFICILQNCQISKHAANAQHAHLHACYHGLDAIRVLGNRLVSVLVECGNVVKANQVFHRVGYPDDYSCTSLIQGYTKFGESEHALNLFQQMQQDCVYPSLYMLQAVLRACTQLKFVKRGQEIHSAIVTDGFETDVHVGSTLVDMYAKCGSLPEAQEVFDELPIRNVVSWTALIAGYTEHDRGNQALKFLAQMQLEDVPPNAITYACSLKACSSIGAIVQIHGEIIKEGYEREISIGNALVDMYAKCDSLGHAQEVFNELPIRDIVSWNTLIAGYAEHGLGREALDKVEKMQFDGVGLDAITCLCSLKACSWLGDLHRGLGLHTEVVKHGFERERSVANSLINMYMECGSLAEACEVFDELPARDVVSWTALITGHVEHGLSKEALLCLEQMKLDGISPNAVTYVCCLRACCGLGAEDVGLEIHTKIVSVGLERDPRIANSLVDMYVKCCLFMEAHEVFDKLQVQDVVSWNALIAGYAEQGLVEEVIKYSEQMQLKGVPPDGATFVSILKCCGDEQLDRGREIHANIVKDEFERDSWAGNTLVSMYAKCGLLTEAWEVFNELPDGGDVISWTALIAGYAEYGLGEGALNCLEQMQAEGVAPNAVTFVCSLKACCSIGAIESGQETHIEIVKKGFDREPAVGSSLVDTYAKCCLFAESEDILSKLPIQDVVSWSSLVAGYAENGLGEEALYRLEQMRLAGLLLSNVTYLCSLKACGSIGTMGRGRELHSEIVKVGLESDTFVGTTLVDMYFKCGSITEAQQLFDVLPVENEVSWNALIAGYADHGLGDKALTCFKQMQSGGSVLPDAATFVCTLKGIGSICAIEQGQRLHDEIAKEGFETHLCVGSALVDMYVKCDSFAEARGVFDELLIRDEVLWTTLISGYVEHGLGIAALSCLEEMQMEGMPLNSVTYVCCLKACGSIGLIGRGQELHAEVSNVGLETDLTLGNTLVDMYGKCGLLAEASEIFDMLPVRNEVAWNALIIGYACHGENEGVIHFLESMREEGLEPNDITLLSVLTACSHAGFVDEGRKYYEGISKEYGITLAIEHHNSMVDLLGRAGQLDEALAMLDKLPFQPDAVTWNILLGACQKWGHVELGRQAFEPAVRLDDDQAAKFILMSNICSNAELMSWWRK